MSNSEQLVGSTINRIHYRGYDIFTIIFSINGDERGLNFIDCFSLKDFGVVGKRVINFSISRLGHAHIAMCDKFGLDPNVYQSFWIKASGKDGEISEMLIAAKEAEISESIHLYNPISEDKY